MANKLNLPSYESLLQSGEQARDNGAEKVVTIPIDQIKDFEGHPFHVSLDQDMLKLIDSIQENGQMVPVFVRPAKDGNGYEMIAGHRRKFAFQQLGMTEIQAIVRDLDDDQASIISTSMCLDYCFVRNVLYIVRYSINYFFENSVKEKRPQLPNS